MSGVPLWDASFAQGTQASDSRERSEQSAMFILRVRHRALRCDGGQESVSTNSLCKHVTPPQKIIAILFLRPLLNTPYIYYLNAFNVYYL